MICGSVWKWRIEAQLNTILVGKIVTIQFTPFLRYSYYVPNFQTNKPFIALFFMIIASDSLGGVLEQVPRTSKGTSNQT